MEESSTGYDGSHETSWVEADFDGWSYNPYLTAFVPKPFALISIMGSYIIIREVVHDLRHPVTYRGDSNSRYRMAPRTMLRALLGLCVGDVAFSVTLFLGTWMFPQDDPNPYVMMNVGNFATCNLQGVLGVWGLGTSTTMTLLYIAFSLLMVRYRHSDADLARIEPYAVAPALFIPTVFSLISVPLQVYNPQFAFCNFAPHPLNCKDNPDVTCTRGEHAGIVGVALYSFVFLLSIILAVLMVFLWRAVRTTEEKIARYSTRQFFTQSDDGGGSSDDGADMAGFRSSASDEPETLNSTIHKGPALSRSKSSRILSLTSAPTSSSLVDRKRSGEVATQALLYTSAYFAVILPSYLNFLIRVIGLKPIHVLRLLDLVLIELLGFFNLTIFCRTRKDMKTPEGRMTRTFLFDYVDHYCCCRFKFCGSTYNNGSVGSEEYESEQELQTQQQQQQPPLPGTQQEDPSSDDLRLPQMEN